MADVVEILVDEVRELARLGCEYVQLDAPHYPLLIDPRWRRFYEDRGWTAERWLSYGIELDNAVIDAAPAVTFGFHLCRGNQGSRWLVAGAYDAIAEPIFGADPRPQRLLLEYDDERSGSFDAARERPRRQGRRARARDDEDAAAGERRTELDAADRGGGARRRPRAARARHAVRLRHVGRRQRAQRRGRSGASSR